MSAYMDIVAGDFRMTSFALSATSQIIGVAKERFAKFLKHARTEYDMIILDCNPSASVFTLCALEQSTDILVPVRPDRYSILGVEMLASLIKDDLPSVHPKPKLHIIINDVLRYSGAGRVERELRAHPVYGPETLTARIFRSSLLAADPSYTGVARKKPVANCIKIYLDLLAAARELDQRLTP
jgi:chromosome partitioning protein